MFSSCMSELNSSLVLFWPPEEQLQYLKVQCHNTEWPGGTHHFLLYLYDHYFYDQIVFDKQTQAIFAIVLNKGQNCFICEIYEKIDHICFDPHSSLILGKYLLNDRMNGRKKVRGKIREKKEAEKRKIAVLISVLNS